jgi:hypothetical protein
MIRAELSSEPDGHHHRCIAEGIEAIAEAPVLALCRKLVEAGHDPTSPMEVYRGDVLALHVRSIGEAARLEIGRAGFQVRRECRGGSPVRYSREGATTLATALST